MAGTGDVDKLLAAEADLAERKRALDERELALDRRESEVAAKAEAKTDERASVAGLLRRVGEHKDRQEQAEHRTVEVSAEAVRLEGEVARLRALLESSEKAKAEALADLTTLLDRWSTAGEKIATLQGRIVAKDGTIEKQIVELQERDRYIRKLMGEREALASQVAAAKREVSLQTARAAMSEGDCAMAKGNLRMVEGELARLRREMELMRLQAGVR
jgi:chromosome segregation ATPase